MNNTDYIKLLDYGIDCIFSNDFFDIVSDYSIDDLTYICNTFIEYLSKNHNKELSSIMKLLCTPIFSNHFINHNNTYCDFNIDINFFNSIANYNAYCMRNEKRNLIVSVKDFKFTDTKLDSFLLFREYHNIGYEYNKNYDLTSIIFSNNEKVLIN